MAYINDKVKVPENSDEKLDDIVCSAEFGDGCKDPAEDDSEEK